MRRSLGILILGLFIASACWGTRSFVRFEPARLGRVRDDLDKLEARLESHSSDPSQLSRDAIAMIENEFANMENELENLEKDLMRAQRGRSILLAGQVLGGALVVAGQFLLLRHRLAPQCNMRQTSE